MPLATIAQQNAVIKLLPKLRKALAHVPGILNVAAGFKIKGGVTSDDFGFVVYVGKKFNRDVIENTNILIPPALFNYPVDIVAIAPDYHDMPRVDPLLAGISISNTRFASWGTVGCYVKDPKKPTRILGLSNYHVLVDNGKPFQKKGKVGDRINQPGLQPDLPLNNIGTLFSYNKQFDCAVFELNQSRQLAQTRAFNNVVGSIGAAAKAIVGTLVKKVGAASDLTFGQITSVTSSGFMVGINDAKRPANNIISMSGDSGAVWMTDDDANNIVGLHYGGDTSIALAHNIDIVFKKLNVTI